MVYVWSPRTKGSWRDESPLEAVVQYCAEHQIADAFVFGANDDVAGFVGTVGNPPRSFNYCVFFYVGTDAHSAFEKLPAIAEEWVKKKED